MKILYSANQGSTSGIQAARIVRHLSKFHEVRVAAYISAAKYLSFEWNLSVLKYPHSNLKYQSFLSDEYKLLEEDISDWHPDLIISDAEYISSKIAYALNIPLWYCSSLLLENGIKWKLGAKQRYNFLLVQTRKTVEHLVPASKYLIYSPIGDLENAPQLNDGFEWVMPYYENINTSTIDGNTNHLSDLIYNEKHVIINIDKQNPDTLLNSRAYDIYKSKLSIKNMMLDEKIHLHFNAGAVK